ncbi:mRNA-decapping enzyme 1A [Sphaerodactylus townsendi]|uniref:mRNA-decapping enzyme 1A n=1 Tax=Sphaerodactylus townsendi TaxID=933632 RepID=UPI002026781D|nr:mRNA-decapping enzyme 1A [Sphaerodactylus townsendi]
MESLSKAGQEMSLAALKQHDPYITSIADVTGQVALYSFSPKTNEWEKTDIEGTLFVYKRSASPYHGFTIVNRLNMHNLVEPVNKDLEFQLHEPFLLYRNANLSIYSIWFYDKNDCHRIAKLMAKVVQEEAQRSQDRTSPRRTNGCSENKSIDILEMLSKAKVEYDRTQNNDLSCGMQPSTKAENMETSEVGSSVLQMQDHSCPSIHKHLTVEELFGTSMPKDSPPVPYPNPERTEKLQNDASCRDHNFLLPFSFEQSTVIHQPLGKLDGPSFKSGSCTLLQQECVPPLLIAPPPVSQPEITKASNYTVQLSPVVNSASVVEAPSVPALPSLHTNNNIMQVMQQATKQVSPLGNQLPSDMNHGPPNLTPSQNHFITSLAAANTDTSNVTLPNMNLLKKLRLTPQHDQIQQSLSKTPVAPNFSSAVNQLATPDCFKESLIKQQALTGKMLPPTQTTQQGKEPETFAHPKTLSKANQVSSPQVVPATTTMASSVLLSPSVFQQSSMKPSEMESKVGSSSPLPLGDVQTLPPTVLSRSQLQETLIHLIKNDSNFLSTLHEVYLQVLTKNTDGIKL